MFKLSRCSSIPAPLPLPRGAACRIIYNALNMSAAAWVSKSCSESGLMPQRVPSIALCHGTRGRGGSGAGAVEAQGSAVPLGDPTMPGGDTRHSPRTVPSQGIILPCGKYFMNRVPRGGVLSPYRDRIGTARRGRSREQPSVSAPVGSGGVSAPVGSRGGQPFRTPLRVKPRAWFFWFSPLFLRRVPAAGFKGALAGAESLVGAMQRQLFCNSPGWPFQNQPASVSQPQHSVWGPPAGTGKRG